MAQRQTTLGYILLVALAKKIKLFYDLQGEAEISRGVFAL
jgi:hypothetical protein